MGSNSRISFRNSFVTNLIVITYTDTTVDILDTSDYKVETITYEQTLQVIRKGHYIKGIYRQKNKLVFVPNRDSIQYFIKGDWLVVTYGETDKEQGLGMVMNNQSKTEIYYKYNLGYSIEGLEAYNIMQYSDDIICIEGLDRSHFILDDISPARDAISLKAVEDNGKYRILNIDCRYLKGCDEIKTLPDMYYEKYNEELGLHRHKEDDKIYTLSYYNTAGKLVATPIAKSQKIDMKDYDCAYIVEDYIVKNDLLDGSFTGTLHKMATCEVNQRQSFTLLMTPYTKRLIDGITKVYNKVFIKYGKFKEGTETAKWVGQLATYELEELLKQIEKQYSILELTIDTYADDDNPSRLHWRLTLHTKALCNFILYGEI